MKRILVTGGTGLVGSQFKDVDYSKIGSNDLNLLEQKSVQKYLQENKFEGIIHCAARVGGIMGNMTKQGQFFYENVLMNTILIEEARKAEVQKLICFLSTCVFPNEVDYPLTIKKIHLGPPHSSNYGYSYAKRMAEVQMRSYNEQYGLNYFGVIPCNIYGPNDFYNLQDGHVIPSLMHKMYIAKEKKEDLTIWGSGKPLREFIFSKDVANLTSLLYENYKGKDPIILSSSEEFSIKEVVEMMVEIFGFKGSIKFDTSKPEGQFRKPSDSTKIKDMFPSYKFTDMYVGLKESIDWFVENYENARK